MVRTGINNWLGDRNPVILPEMPPENYQSQSMNIVKLQDIKLMHTNPLHSYTLTMEKQKDELRKQSHPPLQQKEYNTQE